MATNEAAIDVTGVAGSSHDFSTPPSPGGRASSRGVTGEKSARIVESTPATPTKKRQFSMTAAAKPVVPVDHDDTNKSGQPSRYLPELSEMNIKKSVPHTTNNNKAIAFKFDIGRCVAKNPPNGENATKSSIAFKPYKSMGPLPVLRKLDECDRVITIDIETHRLIHDSEMIKNRWVELDFGLPGRVVESCIHELHIAQIGWTVGGIDQDEPRVVQRVIKPEGFHISADATQKHHTSHEAAMNNGEPLQQVLKDLLADVRACCVTCKGRLAAHHLAFDAGIVAHELIRCGLGELYEEWASFAR